MLLAAQKLCKGQDYTGEEPAAADTPQSVGYNQLTEKAQALMRQDPALTFAKAFEVAYHKHPELVAMDKAAHVAKVTKAMGH